MKHPRSFAIPVVNGKEKLLDENFVKHNIFEENVSCLVLLRITDPGHGCGEP